MDLGEYAYTQFPRTQALLQQKPVWVGPEGSLRRPQVWAPLEHADILPLQHFLIDLFTLAAGR